jgi:dienelactone hydrolase
MIHKFPFVDEDTKEKIEQWLKTQEAEAKSDAYKYEAWNNHREAEHHRYKASTFASIKVHLNYHMKSEE